MHIYNCNYLMISMYVFKIIYLYVIMYAYNLFNNLLYSIILLYKYLYTNYLQHLSFDIILSLLMFYKLYMH